ncbi:hypothetical protein BDZ97DRAFT_1842220 [Flammula alnicola]|nr:hypothetical protein BDZ97DRAFT_1842220 [Flammula alnicola]
MTMLSNFAGIISGGNFTSVTTNVDETSYSGFGLLAKNTCIEARHNSGNHSDESKCHPGTRVEILKQLEEWAAGAKYNPPIRWLHGPAGAGKTIILKTVARILHDQKILLADFFFRRTAAGRNNADQLFATLAYQVCINIPASRSYIEAAVKKHPLIFGDSLEDQAEALIIDPLVQLSDDKGLPKHCARVIIIDGLDECHDADTQCEVLRVLEKTIQKLPAPFAILIASRPEHRIRLMFDLDDLNRSSSRIALDATFKPDVDIKKFFLDNFHKIQKHHPLRALPPMSEPWPTAEIVEFLVQKASGQFIYASTVIKFVDSSRHNPAHRLGVILGSKTTGSLKPFGQLDDLYSTIFQALDEEDRMATLSILPILLSSEVYTGTHFSRRPMRAHERVPSESSKTPKFLESFLGIESHEIRRLLIDLESLLAVTADDSPITVFHASLPDFLFDRFRSGPFFIDQGMTNERMARQCLNLCFASHSATMTNYLAQKLSWFLHNATPTPELENAVRSFDIIKLASLRNDEPRIGNYGLHRLCEPVLRGIQKSMIPNAEDIYIQKVDIYKTFLQKKMAAYLENRLTHILLFSVTPRQDLGYVSASDGSLVLFFPVSEEISKIDRDDGLWFLTQADGILRPPLFLLGDLIHDVMQHEETTSYTDLALHLAKCMQQGSSFYVSGSEMAVVRDGGSRAESPATSNMNGVLPAILLKSAIRSDLVEHLSDDRIGSEYREQQGIRDAICDYLTRAKSQGFGGIEPSQNSLVLKTCPFQIGPRKSSEQIIHAHAYSGAEPWQLVAYSGPIQVTLGTQRKVKLLSVVESPLEVSANTKGSGRSWTPLLFNITLIVAVVAFLLATVSAYTV